MSYTAGAPTSTPSTEVQTVPIVILGTDAVLAALPATPVQLAHACLRAGFANVIPASWGDELIASAVLHRLPQFGNGPAIQCSCPYVAHRLLSAGGDLRPVMLPLVSPPVAVARYVRALAKPARARITYVGACPGAVDESIDIRMSADALIGMLAERDIVLEEQPSVFESIIPPDRRRYRSLPGGVPTAEALWSELGSRTLVEVDSDDFVSEIAQHLLTGKNVLLDASARLGCACAGAVGGARGARAQIAALEPPRATAAIVDEAPAVDLELPVPAVPRTPVDVVAVSQTPPSSHTQTQSPVSDAPTGHRGVPARTNPPAHEPRPPRLSTPVVPRSVLSAFPVARDVEGRALPRAYVARRRSSPKGVSVMLPPEEATDAVVAEHASPSVIAPATVAAVASLSRPMAVATPAVSAPSAAAIVAPVPIVAAPPAAPPMVTAPLANPMLPAAAPKPEPVTAQQPVVVGTMPLTEPIAPAPTPRADQPSAPVLMAGPVPAPVAPPPVAPRPSRPSSARPTPAELRTPPAPAGMSRGLIVLMALAIIAIAVCASTVVAVIVSRSSNPPAAASSYDR